LRRNLTWGNSPALDQLIGIWLYRTYTAEVLINHGADLEARNEAGRTVLYLFVREQAHNVSARTSATRFLIDKQGRTIIDIVALSSDPQRYPELFPGALDLVIREDASRMT